MKWTVVHIAPTPKLRVRRRLRKGNWSFHLRRCRGDRLAWIRLTRVISRALAGSPRTMSLDTDHGARRVVANARDGALGNEGWSVM